MPLGPLTESGVDPAFLSERAPQPRLNWAVRRLFRMARSIRELGAFTLIALAVMITKHRTAPRVIHPLIRREIFDAGVRMLPMIAFLAIALGLVVIGQTVALLSRVGATNYAGIIMVTVVVRELGPLAAALLVLARIGTATVIELGTSRAMGEVEALEAMGIDPIHFLVVPRVVGLAVSVFSLTIYLVLIALASGYLFAFLQDVPLWPGEYFGQIAGALRWEDFLLLAIKTAAFGLTIAVVACYRGLARSIRIEDVGGVTTQAVVEGVVICVLLDALFIVVYLIL